MEFLDRIFVGENAWLYGMIFIFFARICDVSIGTVRIILVAKGRQGLAPLFGFFEVLIWIVAVGTVIKHLDRFYYCLAYAAGFATGNYIGILIENKLAIGSVIIRILTRTEATSLIKQLRAKQYRVTYLPANGNDGEVDLIFTVVRRRFLDDVIHEVKELDPNAYYTVEDVRSASQEFLQPETLPKKFPSIFEFGSQGK